jgi:hypothetical protein
LSALKLRGTDFGAVDGLETEVGIGNKGFVVFGEGKKVVSVVYGVVVGSFWPADAVGRIAAVGVEITVIKIEAGKCGAALGGDFERGLQKNEGKNCN